MWTHLEFYSSTINQSDADGPPHSRQTPRTLSSTLPCTYKELWWESRGNSKAERECERERERERRWEERWASLKIREQLSHLKKEEKGKLEEKAICRWNSLSGDSAFWSLAVYKQHFYFLYCKHSTGSKMCSSFNLLKGIFWVQSEVNLVYSICGEMGLLPQKYIYLFVFGLISIIPHILLIELELKFCVLC